ncbi:hypothetical protein FANTH_9391 [Fusarium anthophilum]|uniref:Uncharacterized protein n=1 Tax=Fusarium anthophilum TaxID=48485 RepID=A0A8H4Z7D7_9HYPO|nr:hypothetical protein FANTH_9391 [Fusarium anthophilum]
MAEKSYHNPYKVLTEFNVMNGISAFVGAMSLVTVIFEGAKVDEDKVSLLAATSFFVGATISSTMELVVATLLSLAYEDRFGKYFAAGTGETTSTGGTPILLWAPSFMTYIAAAQFVAGLILWRASISPTWCTVFFIVVLFALLWVAIAAGLSIWKNRSATSRRG